MDISATLSRPTELAYSCGNPSEAHRVMGWKSVFTRRGRGSIHGRLGQGMTGRLNQLGGRWRKLHTIMTERSVSFLARSASQGQPVAVPAFNCWALAIKKMQVYGLTGSDIGLGRRVEKKSSFFRF